MSQFVAFIRAINVGGHGVVKMEDLKAAFISAGCKNVRTFIASGNVIFESPSTAIQKKVLTRLRDLTGRDLTVMFRSVSELERTVKDAPLKASKSRRDVKLYVVFMDRPPAQKPKLPLRSEKEAVEVIGFSDGEVFILTGRKPNGYPGDPNGFIEKELGVKATTRNFSTVSKILALVRKESEAG
jgi:uncharacterized protein (DUF1697 family)